MADTCSSCGTIMAGYGYVSTYAGLCPDCLLDRLRGYVIELLGTATRLASAMGANASLRRLAEIRAELESLGDTARHFAGGAIHGPTLLRCLEKLDTMAMAYERYARKHPGSPLAGKMAERANGLRLLGGHIALLDRTGGAGK